MNPFEEYAKDAHKTDHIIVGAKEVLTGSQHEELARLGATVLEDLGGLNYLCHYKPADLTPLRLLSFVRQVDVYRNAVKIPRELREMLEDFCQKNSDHTLIPCALDVMVHADGANVRQVADKLADDAHLDRSAIECRSGRIRLMASWAQLQTIIKHDSVRIVEEVVTPELHDREAVSIIWSQAAQAVESNLDVPKHRGRGQVINVVDTGFDLGSLEDRHPSFARGTVTKLISAGRADKNFSDESKKFDDPDGHGTHVCATIVGRGIETTQGLVTGVAPEAQITMTSMVADGKNLMTSPDIERLFEAPRESHKASIHSNSWGDRLNLYATQRAYTTAAAVIDNYVCKHPEALVIFSAGNNNLLTLAAQPAGEQKPAIGSQAAAKNCLTVGASGTTRIMSSADGSGGAAVFGPDSVLADSSQGPTAERRTKPDVVAPGYNIFSAFSRHPLSNYSSTKAVSSEYEKVFWNVRSGTSHATPLVAGCAAILREIAIEAGGFDDEQRKPPAALLKAVIINGANELPGVSRNAQGFGRVNLVNSAAMLCVPAVQGDSDMNSPILFGEGRGAYELKVTMVYNDIGNKEMQNNLNLSVIDHSVDVLHHGGLSEDDMALQNNVEQVVIRPVPKSPVTVRVAAQKMLDPVKGTQDFALAWIITPVYTGYKR
ncbi:peptidase S8/S53 domain-containing protein [Microdochium bolleyi]|uniref:Peptidase S8/S53 domain-containing protein n=1 Tax=Microdochium bolleyi TaxID=196109 RepID=A0A136ILP3_9PEZI|nr:peptidase S8/S53 domain-containing protein [Microdochium bolleyi]